MSKFKRGLLIVDQTEQTLFICLDNILCAPIKVKAALVTIVYCVAQNRWPLYKIATSGNILDIMTTSDYPMWVKDIFNELSGIPTSIAPIVPKGLSAVLNPGVQLPFPIPEAPLIPKVELSMSLKTFQSKCIHDWIEYRGFSREYKYCKHCDKKE